MHSRRRGEGKCLLTNYLSMAIPVTLIRAKFLALKPVMDERLARLWAGAEAEAIGAGGITLVAAATGMSRTTIRAGRDELRKGVAACDVVRVRRAGAGRPSIEKRKPEIISALDHLLEPTARGDREAPLRWTSKSTRKLSAELDRQGFSISPQKVAQLLHAGGYRLLGVDRPVESASHALRGQQLALINDRVKAFQSRGAPVIAVETRKQLAPAHSPGGASRWDNARVAAQDLRVCDADALAAPGASEVAQDAGWVNAEVDHETPAFAVRAISEWWDHMGRRVCGGATELLVIAAAAGNHAYARRWRTELQLFADRTRLTIGVSHFPPGTSKWTRIEHCLICRITEGWWSRPAAAREPGAAGGDGLPGEATGRAARGTAPPIHDGGTGNAEPDGCAGAAGSRAPRGIHGGETRNEDLDDLAGAPTGGGPGGIHRETVVQLIGGARPLAGSLAVPALDAHGLPAEWNYTLHPRRDRW